jgi:hypothetical protein
MHMQDGCPVLIKGDLARAIRSREEEPVASRPVV